MTPAGHLAVVCLARKRFGAAATQGSSLASRSGGLALGALAPDLFDKPIYLAALSPYGRTVGHSLSLWIFACVLSGAAVRLRLPRAPALEALTLGGLLHLGTDVIDDVVEGLEAGAPVFSAWAGWPVTTPDMWALRVGVDLGWSGSGISALELAVIALTLGGWLRSRRRREQQA